ncbi:D-2-hydroxyglutarate dehydrogenase, mitochondrial-like [Anthonomus grandis grandis]|uniref:D-2-hydroxyglutarate dehydrogenase, mitochondrial-like n=1 Tax=Anthonomus grandis grandis TaxID=2921223 RepID=UPI002165F336|nr:D-2-hydroxyglutarate dehydrogenase, mitochondrial-like [Anthonomus grandis grandis]
MLLKQFLRIGLVGFSKKSCRSFTKQPDFTKNTYQIERGFYNYLQEPHLNYFKKILGDDGNRVITDESLLEHYNIDWFKNVKGSSKVVLKPKTTEEVSKIVSYCNANKLAVCTQGGNTGYSAGAVPVFDEVILSMELMNQILDIDVNSGNVVCQSGIVLENLDNILAEKGMMVPLDLGAKGSCQIGGNVATNAGGLRLVRYGNMHGNVLGLEVVKANGEVLDCLKVVRKDNSGLHIKNLFIGSEGTLGIITKVALRCPIRPKTQHVAFLGLQNYEKVLKTLRKCRQDLDEIISAIEVMDSLSLEWGEQHTKLSSPIGRYPYYLLIETSGSNEQHDEAKIQGFLESALNGHYILNGVVTGEPSKVKSLWAIRERLPEGFKNHGWVGMYDLSMPTDQFYNVVDELRTYLKNSADYVFGFGHLGDGNLHLHVITKKYDKRLETDVEKFLMDKILPMKGSMSSEHGLGFIKRKYLPAVNSSESYHFMTDLKKLLDPNRILNPYKVFP